MQIDPGHRQHGQQPKSIAISPTEFAQQLIEECKQQNRENLGTHIAVDHQGNDQDQ